MMFQLINPKLDIHLLIDDSQGETSYFRTTCILKGD